MRSFFILLLLANIAYFAWQITRQTPDDRDENLPAFNTNGRLVLLSEVAEKERPPLHPLNERHDLHALPDPASPLPDDAPQAQAQSGSMLCVEVSMIRLRSDLDKLLEVLRQHEIIVVEQTEDSGVSINYWVILPPYRTRAQADAAAAKLTAKRFSDFFIVRTGEYENAISLGVFSSEERADRRLAQVKALALGVGEPRIELREQTASYYRLHYRVDSQTQANIGKQAAEHGAVKVEVCQ